MSHAIALRVAAQSKKLTREKMLALIPPLEYNDGRTKQAFKDETDIQKIMARADIAGSISHLEKYQGVYADFADFDFHEHKTKLAEGETVFGELPAEVRREFGQSAGAFFEYVNDPENKDRLGELLPDLAKPGTQKTAVGAPDADTEAAQAAASEPASVKTTTTVVETTKTPSGDAGDG